jgi:hypothetical protein
VSGPCAEVASRARAASWMILTVRVVRTLPWTVISRCHRSTSLRRGSPGLYRMPASSPRWIPVAQNTAIIAAPQRCWNDRPVHARSSLSRSPEVKTGTGRSGTCGGRSPAIGSGISSSAASHLKNYCRARNWLLAYAAPYR